MSARFIVITVCLLSSLLAACAASATQPAATPIPTPSPKCQGDVCIRQVFVTMDGDNLRVEFDLTDKNGKVEFGSAPQFNGEIAVGAYRIEQDETESYMFGVQLPPTKHICYVGNDLPWANGQLGASCGFVLPINILQVRPEIGDILRVETLGFGFEQITIIKGE